MNTKINAAGEIVVSAKDIVKRAQQIRMRRFGMSVPTYAVALLATFLITFLGIGDLTVTQWSKLIGLCLFGISLFFLLFYTRVNLYFPEPSLTREQIIYSFFYAILVMHWLPNARPIILLFFLPPFSFGVLSLTLRQYIVVVACILGLYAALLGYEYFQDRQNFMIQYQLFLFVLYSLLLIWFALFGGFVSNIRQQLKIKKDEMKNVNEEIKIEIEERKRLEKDLKEMANTDSLTGIMNRRHFFKRANIEISRHQRFNHPMAILMLDIDHFKSVNDTFGHPAGDKVLESLSSLLKNKLRKVDLIARIGGEEFAVLLVETPEAGAITIAHRILKSVEQKQITYEDQTISVSVSIGVSQTSMTDKKETVETLISQADSALYSAKNSGRNTIKIFK